VAYRDRGDEYATKVFDLTDDLDAIHGHLKKFVATGGGDAPESVNQALDDAVNKVKWSTDRKTLRIIFLVGDAPPHMDYKDDVKYPLTCKKACAKGIIVNTIQCGTDPDCTKYWKEIAKLAEGSYAAIPQAGGVVAIATPFDGELAKLNRELARSTVAYGAPAMRTRVLAGATSAATLPAPVAADRAAYAAKSGTGGAAAGDLLKDIKAKRVKLEDVKEKDLPGELKKLKSVKERKEYLDKLDRKRAEINKKVIELDKKRDEYIKAELKKKGKAGKDSFDSSVLGMLRKQAKKHKIDY
jgi:Skp family chaperone for outer membrane proteins